MSSFIREDITPCIKNKMLEEKGKEEKHRKEGEKEEGIKGVKESE